LNSKAIRGRDVAKEVQALLSRQGERFRQARKQSRLSIEMLATKCGLHFNTIGRIERGESETSLEQLLLVAKNLAIPPESLNAIQPEQAKPSSLNESDADFALVDMLDVKASADAGSVHADNSAMGRFAFKRSWLASRGVLPDMARIMNVLGDSMADKICNGDIVLVDTGVRQLEQDGLYVVELGGYNYVKLLQRDFTSRGLQIISFNPAYRPQMLSAERIGDLRISGRVIWHAGES
jgi:phage repressor protein C with HTH and peptisase S24 domain